MQASAVCQAPLRNACHCAWPRPAVILKASIKAAAVAAANNLVTVPSVHWYCARSPTVCSAQRFFLNYANTRQHANILWNQHWGSFRIGGVMLPRRQVSDSRQNSNFDWLSYTQVAVAEAGAVEVMMPISPRTSSCCLQARTLQPVLCRRTSVQL